MTIRDHFKNFQELAKSGIVILVLFSVLAGYLIGQPSEVPLQVGRMLTTLLGVLLIAAGSSALNQVQERKADAQMPRTAKRPLPTGKISLKAAIAFVILTLTTGLFVLAQLSQELFLLGLFAIFSYNVLYTLWWKRKWAFAAVPGAIPGALPILMGHTSAQDKIISPGGIYLFSILFFWQMPHFWTLALKYQEDYAQGGFPTLPVMHGNRVTRTQITIWCLAYVGLSLIAPFFIRVSWIYLLPSILIGFKILQELMGFMRSSDNCKWLRFFLWINLSLIFYLSTAAIDLWSFFIPFTGFKR